VSLIRRNQYSFSHSDLAFAALIVDRLRDGKQPSPHALEQARFIEQWAIVPGGEIFELTGLAWRLPLCQSAFAAPLLAINPAVGWARTVHEWVVIGDPRLTSCTIEPDQVVRRAESWIRRRLDAEESTTVEILPSLAIVTGDMTNPL
jgi:hypothetical protein